jgi:hypothetical protein
MMDNPINRSSVDDRWNLEENADGSTDIYLRRKSPTGHEQNWPPVPTGKFKLMLRAYLPGAPVCPAHQFSRAPIVCRESSGRSDMNRLILKYGYPITAVILAVFAWVVYQRLSRGWSEIVPLAVTEVIIWALGVPAFIHFWPRLTVSARVTIFSADPVGRGSYPEA